MVEVGSLVYRQQVENDVVLCFVVLRFVGTRKSRTFELWREKSSSNFGICLCTYSLLSLSPVVLLYSIGDIVLLVYGAHWSPLEKSKLTSASCRSLCTIILYN
jgi:hypothetical protein